MISIGNIYESNLKDFDEVWIICYSVNEIKRLFETYDHVLHVPELAPREELFKWYRSMVHSGQWNKQAFEKYYVPQFLKDIQSSEASMEKLRTLVSVSSEKNIRLACFCSTEEEMMCHRSIVAGLLFNMSACIECSEAYRVYRLHEL